MEPKILFLEDNQFVMAFYRHLVHEQGWSGQCEFAEKVADAIQYLSNSKFDVVVTDYDLEDGTAFDIISKVQGAPVIFVTGKGNEEIAVKAMKDGVFDYLIKDKQHQFLSKLAQTIERAAKFVKLENQLRENEFKYQLLVESVNVWMMKTDADGYLTFANEEAINKLGYGRKELMGRNVIQFINHDFRTTVEEFYRDGLKNRIEDTYLEIPFVSKNGEDIWVGQSVRAIRDATSNRVSGYIVVARDISERILSSRQIRQQNIELEKKNLEIEKTLDMLTQAKIGKKALFFTLMIAIGLFILSEGVLEPMVETASNDAYIGFLFKGAIALLLKPIDIIIEGYLNRRLIRKKKKPTLFPISSSNGSTLLV